MSKLISGNSMVKNLKGKITSQGDATIKLISSSGIEITADSGFLEYGNTYTIQATPNPDKYIWDIEENSTVFTNGQEITYLPGTYPINSTTLNYNIITGDTSSATEFIFDNTSVTKYLGLSRDICIPKFYSLDKLIDETLVGAQIINIQYLRYWRGSNYIICNADKSIIKTYASWIDLPDDLSEFGYNAYLNSITLTTAPSQTYLNAFIYPIFCEIDGMGGQFNNYTEFSEWLTTFGTFTFEGMISRWTYTNGNSINIDTIASNAFRNNMTIESVNILDNISTIDSAAFYGCTNLKSINIPASVTSLKSAFGNCSNLSKITLNCDKSVITSDNIFGSINPIETVICNYSNSTNLGSYNLIDGNLNIISFQPSDDTTNDVVWRTDHMNQLITDVTFPADCEIITRRSLGSAYHLKSLTIPSTVKTLGGACLFGCTGLSELILNEGLVKIGDEAIRNCSSLSKIVIPSTVTSLGSNSFAGCSNLKTIICLPVTPPSVSSTGYFPFVNADSIYVPASSVETYKSTDIWLNYADKIKSIDESIIY